MQETGGDTPLTDLCAICHANPIKYTCPRCGIHTCSLPCVKRHKTWAQCSGIRNPAAYRPRTELATPSSVDQDFNFISSLERSLSKADDLALDKGLDLTPSGVQGRSHDTKRVLDIKLQERGVQLIKAPKIFSRSKLNKTHWAGQRKGIMWTTEWLCEDGEKRLTNVSETRTVAQTFLSLWSRKAVKQKKRKRSDSETHNASVTNPDASGKKPSVRLQEIQETLPLSREDPNTQGIAHDSVATISSESQDGDLSKQPDTAETPEMSELADLVQGLHFYLLKPNTISKFKCLIPVSPFSTICDVLDGKTILEFPVFHVRTENPENLSPPFIAEQIYDEVYGSDVPVDLPTYAQTQSTAIEEVAALADIDEKKVLEVLHKDIIS